MNILLQHNNISYLKNNCAVLILKKVLGEINILFYINTQKLFKCK